MLDSYYQIYSSDEEAEITHRLHEEESSDRENIERPQAAEAWPKTPTEVEEDQNTTGTDSDIDLQVIVALKEGNRVEHQKVLVWVQRLQQKVKTSLKRCAKHNTPTQLRQIWLLQRLIKNELNKVNEKYEEVLEEVTRERKKQLQKATTTPVEELLSSTEAEEEEGRGPEGTVDTVTLTLKSVPTAASTLQTHLKVLFLQVHLRNRYNYKNFTLFQSNFWFYYTHSNPCHINWVNKEKHWK